MLTLEQVEEGRRLFALPMTTPNVDVRHSRDSWLRQHAEALLDAAERVARQEVYAAEPDGYDSATEAERSAIIAQTTAGGRWTAESLDRAIGATDEEAIAIAAEREASMLSIDLQKSEAEARVAELYAEAQKVFAARPIVANDQRVTNPHAYRPKDLEAWFHARGVVVRVAFDTHPSDGLHLNIKPVKLATGPTNE